MGDKGKLFDHYLLFINIVYLINNHIPYGFDFHVAFVCDRIFYY